MRELKISVLIMRGNMSFLEILTLLAKILHFTHTGNDIYHLCENCSMIVFLVVMSRRLNNLHISLPIMIVCHDNIRNRSCSFQHCSLKNTAGGFWEAAAHRNALSSTTRILFTYKRLQLTLPCLELVEMIFDSLELFNVPMF